MRVQFEVSDELWRRLKRYVSDAKFRHFVAEQALEEWVSRREGRDKKYRTERLSADMGILRPVVRAILAEDTGEEE